MNRDPQLDGGRRVIALPAFAKTLPVQGHGFTLRLHRGIRMSGIDDPSNGPASTAEPGAATPARGRKRAPWHPPKLTRIPLAATLLGGTVGNEGNGVFAFTVTPPMRDP